MDETGNPNRPFLREIAIKNLLSFGPEGFSLELQPLNVLIGPNGSGKSNLFEVLGLLKSAPTEVAKPIREGGGIRNWLWRRQSECRATVQAVVDVPNRQYPVRHTVEFAELNQRFTLVEELIENRVRFPGPHEPDAYYRFRGNHAEVRYEGREDGLVQIHISELEDDQSILSQWTSLERLNEFGILRRAYSSVALYPDWRFGRVNVLRKPQLTDVRQNRLEPDLSNFAMFLNRLRQDPPTKANLIDKLSDAYEGLTDFELNFQGGSVEVYFAEGDLAVPASRLSDGSLRYLCLLALLLDPDPPMLIGIEEPELGLHPDLIPKIADLLVDASSRCQLVVTTHSDVLVDALSEQADSVVVCEKYDGHTMMNRLDSSDLAHWLESYRLGQLWTSGELGGVRW